ncbi:uncharacterized protein LOC109004715 [Juglans regia]|uniref:Uncharacterized protein LOC109004715 n=1 Tax=Juglans regia TaxID=51240 RepID=A0A6P9EPC6_JUGRE|nr:uncharacterized protein LOC109004715 [Juglans regia]
MILLGNFCIPSVVEPLLFVRTPHHAHLEFQKLGRRSPSEYSLEIEDRCMFGNVLSWHPLKLTICWLVLLMLLTISYSSKEPDVEVYGMRRAFSEGDMLKR